MDKGARVLEALDRSAASPQSRVFGQLCELWRLHGAARAFVAANDQLIYIALDGSSTHLYSAGLKTHVMIALKLGAMPAQLMEVLQLGVAQGLDGTHLGVEFSSRSCKRQASQFRSWRLR